MAELNLFRDLVKFSLKDKTKLGQTAKAVTDTYKDAQRFILPRNGIILDNEGDALEGDLRLPFPIMAGHQPTALRRGVPRGCGQLF